MDGNDVDMAKSGTETPATKGDAPAAASASAAADAKSNELPPPILSMFPPQGTPARVYRAERMTTLDPYDTDAWNTVLLHAQTLPIELSRTVLDRFLQFFPTATRYWKYYADREIAAKHYARAEAIFKKCLKLCVEPELWRSYVRYVKLSHEGTPNAHAEVEKAYEYLISHVGMDYNAGPVWAEYIEFLKSLPVSNMYEEDDKNKKIRLAFQRAVLTPVANIELLWREYDRFEHQLDKNLAKELLSKFNSKHVSARIVYRELKKRRARILSNMLARPPQHGSHEQMRDYEQVVLWKACINYEKENPTRQDDAVTARVVMAYKQALLTCRHYPELWKEAASFLEEKGDIAGAVNLYKQCLEAMPYSHLVAFMCAEFHENRKAYKEARAVYQQAVVRADTYMAELENRLEEYHEMRRAQGVVPVDELLERGPHVSSEDAPEDVREELSSYKRLKHLIKKEKRAKALVYIQFMKFARRCEGPKAGHRVFLECDKAKAASVHVFLAAADLEFYVNNNPETATGIFRTGFKRFKSEPVYVQRYLEFLRTQQDHNNMRLVFEQVLPLLPPEKCPDLWNMFVDFERSIGDSQAMQRAERRRNDALEFPLPEMLDLAERNHFMDLWPCSADYQVTLERFMRSSRLQELLVPQEKPKWKNQLDKDKKRRGMDDPKVEDEEDDDGFPRPILSDMLEYSGAMLPPPRHLGPLPDAISRLLTLLPMALPYNGPKYNEDSFMGWLGRVELPTLPEPRTVAEVEAEAKRSQKEDDDAAESMGKRRNTTSVNDTTDLYRKRRQRRLNQEMQAQRQAAGTGTGQQ